MRESGISFCGTLALTFIILKIMGYITWSWWWVLSPIWIPWAAIALMLVSAVVIWLIVMAVCSFGKTKTTKIRSRI